MIKHKPFWIALAVSICILLSFARLVQAIESSSYAITWSTMASGGGTAQSASYNVNGTVGQPNVGQVSSTLYRANIGYWHRIREAYMVYLPTVIRSVGP